MVRTDKDAPGNETKMEFPVLRLPLKALLQQLEKIGDRDVRKLGNDDASIQAGDVEQVLE